MVALKVSSVEQCIDILMADMKHGSPEKQKVVGRIVASVLMQEKDLSADMAAVVSNILMYKMNCVYYYSVYSLPICILSFILLKVCEIACCLISACNVSAVSVFQKKIYVGNSDTYPLFYAVVA
jgi:hypothetical protein